MAWIEIMSSRTHFEVKWEMTSNKIIIIPTARTALREKRSPAWAIMQVRIKTERETMRYLLTYARDFFCLFSTCRCAWVNEYLIIYRSGCTWESFNCEICFIAVVRPAADTLPFALCGVFYCASLNPFNFAQHNWPLLLIVMKVNKDKQNTNDSVNKKKHVAIWPQNKDRSDSIFPLLWIILFYASD